MVSEEYIMSLDIPEADRGLLLRFRNAEWADICPEYCLSHTATRIAQDMARHARSREEHSCGID